MEWDVEFARDVPTGATSYLTQWFQCFFFRRLRGSYQQCAQLAVDSALAMCTQRERLPSTMSTASSLRPMSTSSGNSGASSVKWDEDGLETVKEGERVKKGLSGCEAGVKSSKESRRDSGEGRK